METSPAPRLSFGKYQLVRHLATGGMAEVILARVQGIEGFERHVVIKKIRDERAREARFVQMFLDEARLAAALHHNNIVHVHDIGQENGEYFFTMEYVHGEDLRKLLAHMAAKDGRVPLAHCITIALATAAALHHAHEHRTPDRNFAGIVHRDVSPANILVAFDGNVKVVDFGIAKLAQRTEETGLMKGKVAYMSPEQCLGQDVDRRSDIFCLGIVLYELVTVRRLFKGSNDFLTMASIIHGQIPRPSEVRPDIPAELEAIIMKALEHRPEDRYQTADEMRAALEVFAGNARLQTSTTALADFMRAEFGERDVPWMVEEDEPELSIDFDGASAGVVAAPKEAIAASKSRPFANPNAFDDNADAVPAASSMASAISGAARTSRPSMPLPAAPVSVEVPVVRRRRRTSLIIAGVIVAAGAAAAAVVMTGSSDNATSASVAKPAAASVAPAPAEPPKPVTPPNLMPSAQPAGQAPTAQDKDATAAAPAAPAGQDKDATAAAPTAPTTQDKDAAAAAPATQDKDGKPAASEVAATVEKKPVRPIKRAVPKKPAPKGVWDPKALLPPK